jgi:hypothetical protein
MDFDTIAATPTHNAVLGICLTIPTLMLLAMTAYYTRPPRARHYDVETGTSIQFAHSIMLTDLATLDRTEDDLRDSAPETSLTHSMYATTLYAGDADSEWSGKTDVLSELSDKDVMDTLSLVAISSTSSLGPSSIEGEQGSTPCSPYYSSDQSGVESSPR